MTALIHLNHTVMSLNDDYAGSDDEGSAGGGVLIFKADKKPTHVHRKQWKGCGCWLHLIALYLTKMRVTTFIFIKIRVQLCVHNNKNRTTLYL